MNLRPASHTLRSGIGQVLMDQPHRHRTLAYGKRDPLDRATAHVARREDPREAQLQEVRFPRRSFPDVLLER